MPDLSWSVKQVADLAGGVLYGDETVAVSRIVTDSRQDLKGAMFAALRGERFDGHRFVQEAAEKGAASVLVEEPVAGLEIPQVAVKNTLEAYQTLGLARRWDFTGPLVAVTGSSGKTTTRKLIVSILKQRFNVHQPRKNFNNHVGVPATLLELELDHEAAVLELGCSDFGEIATLTRLSDPTVALITNVGPAHLEKLGDLDGVAKAKGELFIWIKPDSTVVVNLDDPRVAALPAQARRRLTYGSVEGAEVRLVRRTPLGAAGQALDMEIRGKTVKASLPLIGAHNAKNAVAAAAAATAVGLGADEIAQGLAAVEQEPGRLSIFEMTSGRMIVDDTYNANPASMRAALEALLELPVEGQRIAVLGDMLELGANSEKEHLALGRYVAEHSIDFLVTMGKLGAIIDRGADEAGLSENRRFTAATHEEAARLALSVGGSGDSFLIKGSRGMRMENVVWELKKREE